MLYTDTKGILHTTYEESDYKWNLSINLSPNAAAVLQAQLLTANLEAWELGVINRIMRQLLGLAQYKELQNVKSEE